MTIATAEIETRSKAIFGAVSLPDARADFHSHNECVVLRDLVPRDLVEAMAHELGGAHAGTRSRLPWVRSAAHLGYRWIQKHAPVTRAFYESRVFLDFMGALVGRPMCLKDAQDDHACATYAYSRPGDGMRFHYDTCGCDEGTSYTMILGLVDRSTQRLLIDHHKDDAARRFLERVQTTPGTLVIFCGSKVWHGVSPLGEGEQRLVLSMSYATNPKMGAWSRLKENVKDAVLYFGPSALWQRNYGRMRRGPGPAVRGADGTHHRRRLLP